MISQIKVSNQIVLMLFLLIAVISCKKEENNPDPSDFNIQVNNLNQFTQPAELSEPEIVSQTDPEEDPDDPTMECYTTTFKAAPGFDELLAMDPTSDVIFPGAMLEGNSIPTGEYIPINTSRAPITLSISLQNLSGSPVVEIEDPKLSTVREGIKSIMDQEVTSATPAKINFEIQEVYSQEHLNIALGANYRSAVADVQSSFDFSSSQYSNKFILKYLQVYYTIDMDSPNTPSDLFLNLPDIGDLGASTPVYVSSIAYGRMVLYTIESNSSMTDINAAFNAAFSAGGGSIDASYQNIINESSIKALVIGGSGASAANAIEGPSEVYNYISEGGNYSKDSPGAPLSYKLRFIKQGTPVARVVLTSEYAIRQCEFVAPSYKLEIDHVKCIDCPEIGDPEIYGELKAQAYVDGQAQLPRARWSRSESNPLEVKDGQAYGIGTSKIVQLYKPNYNTDYIKVSGWIKEEDGASQDDDFGSDSDIIELNKLSVNVPYPVYLDFDGSVEAKFTLTRLE